MHVNCTHFTASHILNYYVQIGNVSKIDAFLISFILFAHAWLEVVYSMKIVFFPFARVVLIISH